TLASAGDDETVRLWDVATRTERGQLPHAKCKVECGIFTPDGSLLASAGSDAVVRLWDVAARRLSAELKGHKTARLGSDQIGVEMLAFSPDGRLLASAGHDGNVFVWDVPAHKPQRRLRVGGEVLAVAFSA